MPSRSGHRPSEGKPPAGPARRITALVFVYIAVVLAIDTLAALHVTWPFSWDMFQWFPPVLYLKGTAIGIPKGLLGWLAAWPLTEFDFFKFLWWFLVPFLFCMRTMDWYFFTFNRWRRIDRQILLWLVIGSVAVMFLIPYVPALRQRYPSHKDVSLAFKAAFLLIKLVWAFSWLLGWEFLHRYVLVGRICRQWPGQFGEKFREAPPARPPFWIRHLWLLVPLSEGLYHLQKPALEAVGMVFLSLVLTQWTIRRKNLLLPFLVHFSIELALPVFQVVL